MLTTREQGDVSTRSQLYPRLKTNVAFYPFGDQLYHVYDPSTLRHFKMGAEEVSWLKMLSGEHSVDELRRIIPNEYFTTFLQHIERMQLLEGCLLHRRFDPLKIMFSVGNPSVISHIPMQLAILYRQLLGIFTIPLFLLNVLLMLIAWTYVQHAFETLHLGIAISTYFVSLLVLGIAHELSHAAVARSFGIQTTNIGVMLFYFQPAFFVDVSGIRLLTSTRSTVQVLLAGIQANNVMLSVGLLIFLLTPSSGQLRAGVALFIVMNAVLCIMNLIPFIEYDGYYILSALVGPPGLKSDKLEPRLENIIYAIFSNLFALATLSVAVLGVRRLVLRFHPGRPWLDYVSLTAVLLLSATYLRKSLTGAKR